MQSSSSDQKWVLSTNPVPKRYLCFVEGPLNVVLRRSWKRYPDIFDAIWSCSIRDEKPCTCEFALGLANRLAWMYAPTDPSSQCPLTRKKFTNRAKLLSQMYVANQKVPLCPPILHNGALVGEVKLIRLPQLNCKELGEHIKKSLD